MILIYDELATITSDACWRRKRVVATRGPSAHGRVHCMHGQLPPHGLDTSMDRMPLMLMPALSDEAHTYGIINSIVQETYCTYIIT